MQQSAIDRFWKYVDKASDSRGCWLWTGAKLHFGHGAFRGENSKMIKAHRFSWTIHRGGIPKGMCVLHTCDNPSCVNPLHLFLGTRQDNNRDRDAKGRRSPKTGRPFPKGFKGGRPFPKGYKGGNPFPKGHKGGTPFPKGHVPANKLSLDENLIKDLYLNQNKTGAQIAKALGVSNRPVYRILHELNLIGTKPHYKTVAACAAVNIGIQRMRKAGN